MSFLRSPLSVFQSLKNAFTGEDSPEEVQICKSFLDKMLPIHKEYQKQWYMNIAFYLGNQYVMWDSSVNRFRTPNAPSWRVRAVMNRLLPLARTQMSKVLETNMNFYAIPVTQDEDDLKEAKVASKVLKNIHDSSDFEAIDQEIVAWQCLTGNAFSLPVYDPQAGKEFYVDKMSPATNEPQLDENGQPVLDESGQPAIDSTPKPMMDENGDPIQEKMHTGDIVHDVVSPFEVIPDYSTTRWEEMAAVVRMKVRSVDYLKEIYPKDAYGNDSVVKGENIPSDMLDSFKVANMVNSNGVSSDISKTMVDVAITKEMWVMPTPKYPQGIHFLTVGNTVLFREGLSARVAGKPVLPICHYPAVKIPGKLLATSSMEQGIPLQIIRNRLRSSQIEHANIMPGGKLISAKGSVEMATMDDRPIGNWEYDAAFGPPPQFVSPPPMATVVLDTIRLLDAELEDIFGIHDISQGRLPRRATSGVALSILEEKDQTVINPMKDSFISGLQRHFAIVLGIAQDKFDETRVAKIVGRDGAVEVAEWNKMNLKSVEDIRIMKDTNLPASRSAKFELGLNLMKAGIVDRDGALKIMNLDSIADLNRLTPDSSDRIMAQWENAQMAKGIMVYPSEVDDNLAHAKTHQDYLKAHPELSHEIKNLHMQHIQLHKNLEQIKNQPLTQLPNGVNVNEGAQSGAVPPEGNPPELGPGEPPEMG